MFVCVHADSCLDTAELSPGVTSDLLPLSSVSSSQSDSSACCPVSPVCTWTVPPAGRNEPWAQPFGEPTCPGTSVRIDTDRNSTTSTHSFTPPANERPWTGYWQTTALHTTPQTPRFHLFLWETKTIIHWWTITEANDISHKILTFLHSDVWERAMGDERARNVNTEIKQTNESVLFGTCDWRICQALKDI